MDVTLETSAAWGPRGRRLAALALLAVGLFTFGVATTSHLVDTGHFRWQEPLAYETTGVLSLAALLPAAVAFVRRFALVRGRILARLPLHAAFFLAFASAHTLLMWGSRSLLWPALGWGPYQSGAMPWRFVMEGLKQGVGYMALLGVEGALRAARRAREGELGRERLERELSAARLAALKMQLQPHFLFNALNMISSHVRESPAVAEEMIERLSEFLRLTLRDAEAQEVPLETELRFVDAYLAIMKARFEERLVTGVAAGADARRALVPHLVLQPLVENAVEHGTSVRERAGRVTVDARREGDALRLTVRDNGPGLAGRTREAVLSAGVGLSNTASRLRELYGREARLDLREAEGGGLEVVVEIPWREAAA